MPPRRSCLLFLLLLGFGLDLVSMPPRRSCLSPRRESSCSVSSFQCHHGVPASRTPRWCCGPVVNSFNATTAFLLRCLVRKLKLYFRSFNATTAFLLRGGSLVPLSIVMRFNATTAFLLRLPSGGVVHSVYGFNATTAFLLRSWGRGGGTGRDSFQCHHGVPASEAPKGEWPARGGVSMPPRRSCFGDGK